MPSYAPAPGSDDLSAFADDIAARMLDQFAEIERALQVELAKRLNKPNDVLQQQLLNVNALAEKARALMAGLPSNLYERIVQEAGVRGTIWAAEQLGLTQVPNATGEYFPPTVVDRLAAIAGDLHNAYSEVTYRVLRYPVDALRNYLGTDIYQQVVASVVSPNILGNTTVEAMRREGVARFLDKGITGFTDIAGRQWTIGSYTEMATRTAVQRAYLEGSLHAYSKLGVSLVSVIGNRDACKLCGPWFGKVLSTDGTPEGVYTLPSYVDENATVEVTVDGTLEDARASGLWHPNCACSPAPYLPGTSVATAASEFDQEAFDKSQKQRALEREVRGEKRKGEIAKALGDDAKAAKYATNVKDAQRELRELTGEIGRHREYQRESQYWSDGNPNASANYSAGFKPHADYPPSSGLLPNGGKFTAKDWAHVVDGHGYLSTVPGKTVFPERWSAEDLRAAINTATSGKIVVGPKGWSGPITASSVPGNYVTQATVDSVLVEVQLVVSKSGIRFNTAFPREGDGVFRTLADGSRVPVPLQ